MSQNEASLSKTFWYNVGYLCKQQNKTVKSAVEVMSKKDELTDKQACAYLNSSIQNKALPYTTSIIKLVDYLDIKYADLFNEETILDESKVSEEITKRFVRYS